MHPEVHVTQFDIDRVADHRGNSTALAAAADEVEVLIGQAPTARPLTVLAPSALALGAEVDAPALVARAEHAQATDLVLMQLNYARSSFARDDDPTGVVHATYLALGQPIPDRWAVKAAQADRAALPPAHTITCQQCREHIPNDGRFCPFCGVPIT